MGARPPLDGDARRRPSSLHADAGPADDEGARGFRDADRRRPATTPRRREHGAHRGFSGEMLAGRVSGLSDDPAGGERHRESPALGSQPLNLISRSSTADVNHPPLVGSMTLPALV